MVLTADSLLQILDAYKHAEYETDLPPHIFGTAKAAYSAMMQDLYSQSVIISGESGAGKTECTKQILHYIVEASSSSDQGKAIPLSCFLIWEL